MDRQNSTGGGLDAYVQRILGAMQTASSSSLSRCTSASTAAGASLLTLFCPGWTT